MTCRRDRRNNSIERLQDWFPRRSEMLRQPKAEIGCAAKIGLPQDLSDLVELDVSLFLHGSVPDAQRESALKERKLTQVE
jgi:hypothetical protein